MPTPARLTAIRRRLLRWFGAARRDLPWRFPAGEGDPYRVWISEAMLQQTRVTTVIPYYRRFLARFPTLEALAAASEEEVLAAWAGLGYYARGRALLRAAREAMARHGALPASLEALRELPGFGPYTAGAVASIAFGIPTPAVDGNVARVLARLFLVRDGPGTARFRKRVWALAQALVAPSGRSDGPSAGRRRAGARPDAAPEPADLTGAGGRRGPGPSHPYPHPGDLNQALMELGALVCRPGVPVCGRCPVEPLCVARRTGREGSVPRPKRRTAARRVPLGVAVLTRDDRVLIVRRPGSGLFAGMWGPPVVELGAGEEVTAAISAAIAREPFGITGGIDFVGTVERQLTHRRLELLVHVGRLARPPARSERWRLVPKEDLRDLAIPAALRAALEAGLEGSPEGRSISGRERVSTPRRRRAPR